MIDLGEFTDDQLFALALEWRKRALQGEREARGIAHALEVEIRRRMGNPTTLSALLDTRPLAARSMRPWWRFWLWRVGDRRGVLSQGKSGRRRARKIRRNAPHGSCKHAVSKD
jgi:hypothetical protein